MTVHEIAGTRMTAEGVFVRFDDGRVLHRCRRSADSEITTSVPGPDRMWHLSAPGCWVSIVSFFDDIVDPASS